LPFLRLFIVAMIAVVFALGFAEIARQSDGDRDSRSATLRCDPSDVHCAERALVRPD
jgi:hypothetical protein